MIYLNPCAWSCVFTKIINPPLDFRFLLPSPPVQMVITGYLIQVPLGLFTSSLCPSNSPQHCKKFCSWKAHVYIWKAQYLHFLGQICPLDTESSWESSNIIFHGLSSHFTQSSPTAIHCSQMTASALQPSCTGSRCFLFPKCPCPRPKPHLSKSLFFHTVNWYGNTPFCLLLRILVAFVLSSLTFLLIILCIQVVCMCLPVINADNKNPPELLARYFRHSKMFFLSTHECKVEECDDQEHESWSMGRIFKANYHQEVLNNVVRVQVLLS